MKRERADAQSTGRPRKKARDTTSPELSPEQLAVFRSIKEGHNVFFTGCAGTGKSFLLNYLISTCTGHGTFVTALTGMAAVPLKGTTLHRFAGIGLGTDTKENLLKRMSGRAKMRWKCARLLVVDEVSMMSVRLFELLEFIARETRSSKKPFGGLQVVFCGDFLQLPPVAGPGSCSRDAMFAFTSRLWKHVFKRQYLLTKVYRQSDAVFANVLREARVGQLSEQSFRLLQAREGAELPEDGIVPTKLYSTKKNVARENLNNLNRLPGPDVKYEASDYGSEPFKGMLKNAQAPSHLRLRTGAQVMLVRNDATCGLVNGSRGVVVGFEKVYGPRLSQCSEEQPHRGWQRLNNDMFWPTVKFTNGLVRTVLPAEFSIEEEGVVKATRTQVPLRLAWAITIHKSQGMSLDRVEADVSGVFAAGQAYVALSRLFSIEGLRLRGFHKGIFLVDKTAYDFYRNL